MTELAYVNGLITTPAEAKIEVTDAGFHLGYGVFETMRGYSGRLFRLSAHLDRLRSGARFLGFSIDCDEVTTVATKLLAESTLNHARIRIIITGGQVGKPSIVITVEQYLPPSEADYRSGIGAITASIRRNTPSPVYRYKTLNQIENTLAKKEAESRRAVEAVIINEFDQVAETNRGNVFIVKNAVLKTPGLDAGILPGITRAAVLDLARGLDISAIECDLGSAELQNADEIFITSSLIEVMPITLLDGATVGDGSIGPMTARVRRAYQELVAAETGVPITDKRLSA